MLKKNGLLEAIRNDDISALQSFIGDGGNADQKLTLEDLTPDEDDILKCNPPLVSYVTFYAAEECLKYLVNNGIDLTQKDLYDVLFLYFFRSLFLVEMFLIEH